jgi:phage tail-like protein
MTPNPGDRTVMDAAGTAGFVGLASDRVAASRTETAGSVTAQDGTPGGGRLTVEVDGVELPGIRVVDLPRRYTDLTDEEGDDEQATALAGRTAFDDVEMERGLAPDASELLEWRRAVEAGDADAGRTDLTVTLLDAGSESRLTWTFTDAWPAVYEPPALDATTPDAVATESVSVTFDGMERTVEPGAEQPRRSNPLRTGLLRFVETANDGRVSDGAAVVTAGDIADAPATLGVLESAPAVPADRMSLLVPEGARGGDSAGQALWMLSGRDALENAESTSIAVDPDGAGLYWIPATTFFPDRAWGEPEAGADADVELRPVPGWPIDRADRRVLVATGGPSISTAFGGGADGDLELNAEAVEPDESITPGEIAVAIIGDPMAGPDDALLSVTESEPASVGPFFDAGVPAPLAGATFGLATLSTPTASVAGRSANPLNGMATTDLLESEAARRVLKRAGVKAAENVEWLVGPREVTGEFDELTASLLGEAASLRSFEGAVTGQDGPWDVGVHTARVTQADEVVAAGVHSHPAGTPDGTSAAESSHVFARARRFTAETVGRLEQL